jgi:DNA helicase-2/ATP-dependent DNA helicase PcrA
MFLAKFNSKCVKCGQWINKGEQVVWSKSVSKKVEHSICPDVKTKTSHVVSYSELKISSLPPSEYQSVVFEDVLNGEGNRVIEAVAGSGKTWTLIQSLIRLILSRPGNGVLALFQAFNKHIAKELQEKLVTPRAKISTCHSFGLGILRSAWGKGFTVNSEKTKQVLFNRVFEFAILSKEEQRELYKMLSPIKHLISLAKGHLVRSDMELQRVYKNFCDKFGVVVPANLTKDFETCLLETYRICLEDHSMVDFDDMIFLPTFHGFTIPTFPFVFIDESQDLNPAQQELVRLAGANGRVFAVGDRNQAIYGFAGADTDSIPNLIETLNAKVLPLSICYRCGRVIVELAKTIVPHIESSPDAIEGEIETIKVQDFEDTAKDGDFAVCRVTAPLVSHCLNFIKKGRKALVVGRSIGKELESVIKSLTTEVNTRIPEFVELLGEWQSRQIEKLPPDASENRRIAIIDKHDTLIALTDMCETVQDVLRNIDIIFSDESTQGVTLSTIHRAKGMEAKTVFILRPNLLPHPLAKREWELEQEKNLEYVAITRAKEKLVYVEGDIKKKSKNKSLPL